MRFGMVKWFDRDKGYGYIAQPSNNDVFVHHSDIVVADGEFQALRVGELVLFEIAEWHGKIKASRVTILKKNKEEQDKITRIDLQGFWTEAGDFDLDMLK